MITKPQNLYSLVDRNGAGDRASGPKDLREAAEQNSGHLPDARESWRTDAARSGFQGFDDSPAFLGQSGLINQQTALVPPEIVVVASDKRRYESEAFIRLPVTWTLFDKPAEAMSYVADATQRPSLVLSEIIMRLGGGNGFHLAGALRTRGFDGAICLVMLGSEPSQRDRQNALAVHADDVVRFGSSRMFRMLEDLTSPGTVAAPRSASETSHGARQGVPTSPAPVNNTARQPGGKVAVLRAAWVPRVIKILTNFLGPVASDVVNDYYDAFALRIRRPPSILELGEQMAELLDTWPKDRERFIAQLRELNTSQGGR